jgi:site-specific DNA recombinase
MGQDSSGSKLPVIDPQKTETVRTIFALMASGKFTIDTLREELFRRGMYRSPTQQRWTRSHLAKLLHHPFYIGKILWWGQIYEGKHQPLIDHRTWDCVQQVMNGRTNAKHHGKRQFTYGHGLIKRAHCGYSVTAEIHKQRYTYYFCSQRRYHKHPVRFAWVCEPNIESQVIAMNKLILPKEVYD